MVLRRILIEGLTVAAAGLAAGAFAAAMLSKLMVGLLFEVEPVDPATFVAVSILLAGVALTASLMPARRATRVDPMVALRSE
jgi:putative ABC transport system permease protein